MIFFKNSYLRIIILLSILVLISSSSLAKNNQDKMKIAVLDLSAKGVEKHVAENITEVLLSEIDKLKIYNIMGKSDITAMLGFEQEKQIIGCESDTNCIAEIGGALGVEKIVAGSVGKLGEKYLINVKLINMVLILL